QVNRPPHPPREKPADVDTHNLGNRGVMAQRAHLAQASKRKLGLRPSANRGNDIIRSGLSLTDRVLGGRRSDASVRGPESARNRRAPKSSRRALNLERSVGDKAAAFALWQIERFEQWV